MAAEATRPRTTGTDAVNHPRHYRPGAGKFEVIDVIEDWDLNFNLGNALEDLKKARWYLDRAISNMEKPR